MRVFLIPVIAIVIVVAAVMALGSFVPTGRVVSEPEQGLPDIPMLSTAGFTRVSIELEPDAQAVLLTSECRGLSMVTSQEQILSISMGIEGRMGFRPMTHDLIGEVVKGFDVEVLMAKVEELRDGTYFARLVLRQGNRIMNLDSRPSDAVAVAVRTDAPVYVKSELLQAYGIELC